MPSDETRVPSRENVFPYFIWVVRVLLETMSQIDEK